MHDFLLRFDEQSDGCEKSTAKFLRRSPTRERLVGYLTHQPLIGSNLGQTVAIMSMSSAWGMLVEI
jgi:hypothetical protein